MSTNFPGGLDTFPSAATLAVQTLATSPHSNLHENLGDAITALEAKVGVNSSVVTSSLDYKLANNVALLGAANTFTTGPQTVQGIANHIALSGASAGNSVTLTASGSDTNVPIAFRPKGANGFLALGPDSYGASGWASPFQTLVEIYDLASTSRFYSPLYLECYAGNIASAQITGFALTTGTQGVGATQNVDYVQGAYFLGKSSLPAGRTTGSVYGLNTQFQVTGGGTATEAGAIFMQMLADGGSTVTTGFGTKGYVYNMSPSSGVGTVYFNYLSYATTHPLAELYFGWAGDMAGQATNPYYLWFDSRGVLRIREDNVADGSGNPQAVLALYNPRFTKYTPGSENFERVVLQWVSNCIQLATEKGATTGTLRPLRLGPANGVCVGTNSPDASAVFQLDSTTQGFLPPRMTTTQRDNISSPVAGLVIFNTSTGVLNFYSGSAWGAV